MSEVKLTRRQREKLENINVTVPIITLLKLLEHVNNGAHYVNPLDLYALFNGRSAKETRVAEKYINLTKEQIIGIIELGVGRRVNVHRDISHRTLSSADLYDEITSGDGND